MLARLYSTTYCPYAWCTRIVLNEKNVPFEVFEVDLKHKQAEFLEVSPTAKVPVFVDGETKIWESMVINEYLEEKHPHPNLFGDTPEQRAAVRTTLHDHNWSRVQPLARLASMLLYQRERQNDLKIQAQLRRWYQYLDELDEHFAEHDWFAIERFSVADISLYCTVAVSQGFGMRIGTRQYLQTWIDRMEERESVKLSAPETMPALA